MAQDLLDPAVLSILTRKLAGPLGKELKRIYESSIALLELAKVPAAQYRVLQTPGNVTSRLHGRPGTRPNEGVHAALG